MHSPEKLCSKAETALDGQNFAKAYTYSNKAINQKPNEASTYMLRGKAWFGLDETQRYSKPGGCANFEKARSLGYTVNDDVLFFYGCLK